MKKIRIASAAALIGFSMVAATQANAAYIAYLYQDGSNVVGIGSGSLNLSSLSFETTISPPGASISSNVVEFSVGTGSIDVYDGAIGPSTFNNGRNKTNSATSDSGSFVGAQTYDLLGPTIAVPTGYVSGSSLGTSTATWDSTTLNGLGVSDGIYQWAWGSGANADSFTLNIGSKPSSVPEPGSLALLGTGLIGLGLVARRKRRGA